VNQMMLFVLKQAAMVMGLGGAGMDQACGQDSCDVYSYENVTVGKRTERRLYREVDATTPYWITRRSDCRQPCTGDYWMYQTVGKRQVKVYVRDVEVIPKSTPRATGCDTKGDGDYWVYRYDGRRLTRVWMHDVPVDPALARTEGVNPACRDCSYRSDAVDEHSERRGFCTVGGHRADCTTNPPECPECERRTKRTSEEARP